MRLSRLLAVVAILSILSILSVQDAYSQSESRIIGTWEPPLVPVEVTLDSNGNIDVTSSVSWVTPIGRFSLGLAAPLREGESILTLSIDGQERKYRIGGKKLDVRVDGLRLLRLVNDGSGNVTVIATRDFSSYTPPATATFSALSGAWQGGYYLYGYPVTETYTFTSRGLIYDRGVDQFGQVLSAGVGRFAYSDGFVTIDWEGGQRERGSVRWLNDSTFLYRIVSHSFSPQIGLEILFRRLQ
jgi:hypothetical protein